MGIRELIIQDLLKKNGIDPNQIQQNDPEYESVIAESNRNPNLTESIGQGLATFGDAVIAGTGRRSNFLDKTMGSFDDKKKKVIADYLLKKNLQNKDIDDSREISNSISLQDRFEDESKRRSLKDLEESALNKEKMALEWEKLKAKPIKETEEEKQLARLNVKKQINQPKEKALLVNAESNFDRMIEEAEAIKNHPSLGMATGMTSPMSRIPGTGAKNVSSRLNTLKSKTGFSVLQEMRANSPTGGALGQVSDRENQMLQENISSLDQGQSTKDIKDSLDRVINYAKGAKARLRQAYNDYYGVADESGQDYKAEQGQGESKIKVSNGTETFLIDPSDEEDAKKDGFMRVQ